MLFARGRRLFTTASLLLILTAIAHTLGHFSPEPQGDVKWTETAAAMRSFRLDAGFGAKPSIWDVLRGLSLTMVFTLLALGALGIVLSRSPESTPRLLCCSAWVLGLASAALSLLYLHYRVPPPMIMLGVTALLFLAATRTSRI